MLWWDKLSAGSWEEMVTGWMGAAGCGEEQEGIGSLQGEEKCRKRVTAEGISEVALSALQTSV